MIQTYNYPHTTEINIMYLKNYKQIKYQPIREEKLIKYKTTNKYQLEPVQADTPNQKLKTK